MEGRGPSVPPYGLLGHGPFLYGGWGKRDGLFVAPPGLNYLELCRALLAQVGPGPAPRLRKTPTKECGVQVNAKVDKLTQCSLGPKTLHSEGSDPPEPYGSPGVKSPGGGAPGSGASHTPVSGVRFCRPVSIYSPLFDRPARFASQSDGDTDCRAPDAPGDPSCEGSPAARRKNGARQPASPGSNFQFLEQRFGFFHCRKCNIRWESAYVWCIYGTSKVYFKQLCRKCQVGFNPYRVESILCKVCSQTSCCCEKKQRHINMRRPHRQDLCCRCKGARLSCDATYSFKYIV